jgi:nitrite reductase/ring-hydroxylating ferredoxin subunit
MRTGPVTRYLPAATLPLPTGTGFAVGVAQTRIALFDTSGVVHAVEDHCIHCSEPLADGRLDGTHLTCAHCGWCYDLDTGTVLRLPAFRLTTFPVRVQGTSILIEWTLPGDAGASTTDRLTP